MVIATAGVIIVFSGLAAEDITAMGEATTTREAIMAGLVIGAIAVTEAGLEENTVEGVNTAVATTAAGMVIMVADTAGIMAVDIIS
jgi:hypothetical protein